MDGENLNPNGNQNESGAIENEGGAGGGSGSQTSWFEQLPEDVRANEAAAAWKDKTPADVLKAHLETTARLKGAIVPPGDNATPEERQAFDAKMRQVLGVPEKPEGYQLTLPEGVPADDPLLRAVVKDGHVKGLNSVQLQGVIDAYVGAAIQMRADQRAEGKQALETLWKADFNANLQSALAGMKGVAADAGIPVAEVEALMGQTGWGDNPTLVRMFAVIGKHYSEDKFKGQGGGGPTDVKRDKSGNPMLNYTSMG